MILKQLLLYKKNKINARTIDDDRINPKISFFQQQKN